MMRAELSRAVRIAALLACAITLLLMLTACAEVVNPSVGGDDQIRTGSGDKVVLGGLGYGLAWLAAQRF